MKQVNEFSKRLDKIFNDGEPTKALIIDAYIKTNPTAQSEALNIEDVSGSLISAEYLKGLHPELTLKECESLKAFSNNKTIAHKECYGDGSIMYPKWKAENDR